MTTQLLDALLDGIMTVGLLGIMALYSVQLTAIALLTSTGYLLFRFIIYPYYRELNEELIVCNARENTNFMESVRGISSIKVFGLEARRERIWVNLFVEAMNANNRIQKLNIIYYLISSLIYGVDRIVILWVGAYGVTAGKMSIGMLIAFVAYNDQFRSRTSSLINAFFQFRMLSLYGDRLTDIALAEPEAGTQTSEHQLTTKTNASAQLELRSISFSYGEAEECVFTNINLTVEPGECLAITGPSGCGKTTLLKIMAGLIRPTDGCVMWDNQVLGLNNLVQYRSNLACVLQDDRLFAGSIYDNIAAFASDIDREWVEQCAQWAAIHNEIMAMPMRYETLVGDMGSSLSGGQKQRLFLARAFYCKPRILFLDEATSHLDTVNENIINQATAGMSISRVIVAHRASTIATADRVFEMP